MEGALAMRRLPASSVHNHQKFGCKNQCIVSKRGLSVGSLSALREVGNFPVIGRKNMLQFREKRDLEVL